jgi:predicted deacylase
LLVFFSFAIVLNGSISSAATLNQTNITSSNNGYSISTFDKSVGGNVLANSAIKKDIPRTSLSNQIFQMTKKGSVILKFGNGHGPKLLISVGIHGNEPQANIAAMKYIEYIKNKNFNGTIYIIPFDIPKDTALNTRYYNGLDLNRMANIKGTPSWKIVQFAKNNGINYLIDVHSGGGVGKNGFIYHNAVSTKNEKKWISYIISKTKCSTGVDKADNPGMIRIAAHSYKINSITLETERDTTPVMSAAEAEFKMILAATKYLGFP